MKDYLFELTEYSENEGEQILCEEESLEKAWACLIEDYGFEKKELKFLEEMSVEEGEWLGLDTY